LHRTERLITETREKAAEKNRIAKVLKRNGYPDKFLKTVEREVSQPKHHQQQLEPLATVILPYRYDTSEQIQRILQKSNIRTVFKADNTLHRNLVHLKDRIPTRDKTDCIYKISCAECPQCYIGQTSRELKTRITEHQRCSRNPPKNQRELEKLERDSAIAAHALFEDHKIDFENPQIVQHGFKNFSERITAETVHMISNKSNINRGLSINLSPIWCDLITNQPQPRRKHNPLAEQGQDSRMQHQRNRNCPVTSPEGSHVISEIDRQTHID
jgi:hypothetical protein